MDFHSLPKHCSKECLRASHMQKDPFDQCIKWLEDAKRQNIPDFNAMALATASAEGLPSCRMVLLKKIDETGLEFYTNYESRKGNEMRINPHAAATFYWERLSRQINVEGTVETVNREISERYFHTRSRESQIAAWASKQGKEISGRNVLEEAFEQLKNHYENTMIPLPPFWGGFRLIPTRFEFWQGGSHRLHDRFQYLRKQDSWTMARLSP